MNKTLLIISATVCAVLLATGSPASAGSQAKADDPPAGSFTIEEGGEEASDESVSVPADLTDPDDPSAAPAPQTPANPSQPASTPEPPAPAPAGPESQPAPVAQPAKPAPAVPKPPIPAGPPGYPDILVREFSGSWNGGPLTFRWWVSHCGEGRIKYPGGQLDFVMDRSQGDNGYPVSRTVSDFPVKGGKAELTCHGIAPDPAVKSQEITIGPAPVSTQTVEVQKTKTIKKKVTKHGTRSTKTVRVRVTVKATLPTPPDGVPGWCYTDSKGVWGFIQAPVAGSTRSLYSPGYGPHCDPPRVSKADWRLYLNTFYHGKDPRKK